MPVISHQLILKYLVQNGHTVSMGVTSKAYIPPHGKSSECYRIRVVEEGDGNTASFCVGSFTYQRFTSGDLLGAVGRRRRSKYGAQPISLYNCPGPSLEFGAGIPMTSPEPSSTCSRLWRCL